MSVDAIAESIWGVELPRDPTNAVRHHVWKLREAIGESGSEVVATTPGGYVLLWSLMDSELLLATFSDHDPANLTAGFELLTGTVASSRQVATIVGSVESTTP